MTKIINKEQLEDRAEDLSSHNGIERAYISLPPGPQPAFAWLDIDFYNDIDLADIVDDINNTPKIPADVFSIAGGSRIRGDADGGPITVTEVHTVAGQNRLRVKIAPIGDYSSYYLQIKDKSYAIDPLFAGITFKFRPGCFNINCAPLSTYTAASVEPVIDYLAKDFDSFKHLLINAMRERVPEWQPTSEADLDQVLIDLIAADADEISDFQDRVMNEGYFSRARKRVSLARYARLMDYHIHQGNQADTWLALQVNVDSVINQGFGVWSSNAWHDNDAVIFAGLHDQACFTDLNTLSLYTWGGVVTALEVGAREADLIATTGVMTQVEADNLRDLLRREDINYLLVQQKLNPETGTENGVDKSARQILQLLKTGDDAPQSLEDPVNATWYVRVRWRVQDKLQRRYCFITNCSGLLPTENVSVFHGNLLKIAHGRLHQTVFKAPGENLAYADDSQFVHSSETHYEDSGWGVLCTLPYTPLSYRDTLPGGEQPTRSSLRIEVSGFADPWEEQSDLIESESDDFHFIVETDELHISRIRFGNNINGRALPDMAEVHCYYQIGRGSEGNVGADALRGFDDSASGYPNVDKVWNPLDVINGRDPEPRREIIRRVPEAYRERQLRAVTLEDYVKRAEELEEVSHAYARYGWTGSWRTVRISIDPAGTDEFSDELREKISAHLDAVRLIGEDLEIRRAQYASLDIVLKVCAHPDYWPEDLAHELEAEFSDGYTTSGLEGFFHPDRWTFGQALHASQIIGRALSVKGVERVLSLSMRRWYGNSGAASGSITLSPADLPVNEVTIIEVEPFEIIQVASDPNHLEKGRIQFDILGGRQ